MEHIWKSKDTDRSRAMRDPVSRRAPLIEFANERLAGDYRVTKAMPRDCLPGKSGHQR